MSARSTPWIGHVGLTASAPAPMVADLYLGARRHNPLLDVELAHPAVAVCDICGAALVDDEDEDARRCLVHGIRREWRVRYGDGEEVKAERVPCAVPPTVAVTMLRDGADVNAVVYRTGYKRTVVKRWAARIAAGAL